MTRCGRPTGGRSSPRGACGGGGSKEAAGCKDPHFFRPLVPAGTGSAAFTMGIRVQSQKTVDRVAAQIGDRVKDRDVFVIDTPGGGGFGPPR